MNRAVLLLLIFVSLSYFSCSNEGLEATEDISVADLRIESALEAETVQLVNDYRMSQGLQMLDLSQEAYEMALAHSQYMAQKRVLAHTSFDKRAKGLSEKLGLQITVAENLSRNYDSAAQTVEKWVESNGHRTNMLGEYTHTAVAVVSTPSGEVYYTQVFFRQLK